MHEPKPRLFMPGIEDIINKCYQRKGLISYFRIAKMLGIKVDEVKLSTFFISLSRTRGPTEPYEQLIGQISQF